jgi:hypothetical protein
MSTHDPRLTIGLGNASELKSIKVYWPSGKESEIQNQKTEMEILITEPR